MASTYRTVQGDMWDSIAYRLWGNESLMHHLMEANPDHRHRIMFPAGTVLTVPTLTTEQTTKSETPPWQE